MGKLEVEEASKIKRDYFIPNFGQDNEIADSQQNLAQSENVLGIKMEDDYFSDKKSQKVNYFVPNFGQDNEIATSIENTQNTEKALNHKWTVKDDKENI